MPNTPGSKITTFKHHIRRSITKKHKAPKPAICNLHLISKSILFKNNNAESFYYYQNPQHKACYIKIATFKLYIRRSIHTKHKAPKTPI